MLKPELTILSTKTLSEAIISQAAIHNIKVLCVPMISTTAFVDEEKATIIKDLSTRRLSIAITSSNALKAILPYLAGDCNWNIYTIGSKTEQLVRQTIPSGKLSASAMYGTELAKKIIANGDKEVYFFCGNMRSDALPKMLTQHGVLCREVKVYTTTLHPVTVNENYQAVLFFSPSGVESYFSANGIQENTVVFTIGNTTAEAVRKHCQNTIVVPRSTSTEELFKQVLKYYQVRI